MVAKKIFTGFAIICQILSEPVPTSGSQLWFEALSQRKGHWVATLATPLGGREEWLPLIPLALWSGNIFIYKGHWDHKFEAGLMGSWVITRGGKAALASSHPTPSWAWLYSSQPLLLIKLWFNLTKTLIFGYSPIYFFFQGLSCTLFPCFLCLVAFCVYERLDCLPPRN